MKGGVGLFSSWDCSYMARCTLCSLHCFLHKTVPWSSTRSSRHRGCFLESNLRCSIIALLVSQVFPPVCQSMTTYCSMLISNVGSTAISFRMSREKCPSLLVKPSCGYIAPGAHQILVLSTCPADTSPQQHILSMQLNFSSEFNEVGPKR